MDLYSTQDIQAITDKLDRIVDEAIEQRNIKIEPLLQEYLEVKTIITRAGEGTKIVFTGDIYQIDTPYLDSQSNGLSFLIDRFKNQLPYAHITLEKGERSNLANLANNLL